MNNAVRSEKVATGKGSHRIPESLKSRIPEWIGFVVDPEAFFPPAQSPSRLPLFFPRRASTTTATMTSPVMSSLTGLVAPLWASPAPRVAMMRTPRKLPTTEPRPPMRLVPPMTTAAMAESSRPIPALGSTEPTESAALRPEVSRCYDSPRKTFFKYDRKPGAKNSSSDPKRSCR